MSVAHSTVPFPSVTTTIPADYVETPCAGCSAVLLVEPDAPQPFLCRGCQKSHQDNEAHGIFTAVRALAKGEAPFDLLTPDERRVHLAMLNVCVNAARVELAKGDAEAEASILAGPVSQEAQAIAYAHYTSTAADEPSDAEKEAIYAMEAVLDAEEQREDALDDEDSDGDWR